MNNAELLMYKKLVLEMLNNENVYIEESLDMEPEGSTLFEDDHDNIQWSPTEFTVKITVPAESVKKLKHT